MNAEDIRDEINLFFGRPTDTLSSCLRGFIVPRGGHVFIGCDFSSIEARVTAWLADERRLLELFESGKDPYIDAAKTIYNCTTKEVDKQRRQVGKVAVLALGFGGGKGAFQVMAKGYGVKVTDQEAEAIKHAWRAKNRNIVQLWYDLENAAIKAVKYPGEEVSTGLVSYKKSGSFLLCKLPSGREICYPYPKIELKDTPWGTKKYTITSKWWNTNKWERRDVWYGILTENAVQGIARDLLSDAIIRLENEGYKTVMHVHDEVLIDGIQHLQIRLGKNQGSRVSHVERIMSEVPDWATGLPIAAKGWSGKRFQKD